MQSASPRPPRLSCEFELLRRYTPSQPLQAFPRSGSKKPVYRTDLFVFNVTCQTVTTRFPPKTKSWPRNSQDGSQLTSTMKFCPLPLKRASPRARLTVSFAAWVFKGSSGTWVVNHSIGSTNPFVLGRPTNRESESERSSMSCFAWTSREGAPSDSEAADQPSHALRSGSQNMRARWLGSAFDVA